MSEPFLAEVRLFSFGFAPKGWAQCNGQLLPINQNLALYSLLGTTYGGNGTTTFALPDLRGRAPIHSHSIPLGYRAGEETHTLTLSEMPMHTHQAMASGAAANATTPVNNFWGSQTPVNVYGNALNVPMLPLGAAGGNQPHNNMQPYLVLNFCIALTGIFPSPT